MSKTFRLAALFLAALVVPSLAMADHWTAVASTGSVDESNATIYNAGTFTLGYSAGGSLATITARYNVTNTSGAEIAPWSRMEISYSDPGASSSLTATLFQVDKCSGAITTICTVTSLDSLTCNACTFTVPIDFSLFNYVVEARISRTVNNVFPVLRGIRIN